MQNNQNSKQNEAEIKLEVVLSVFLLYLCRYMLLSVPLLFNYIPQISLLRVNVGQRLDGVK